MKRLLIALLALTILSGANASPYTTLKTVVIDAGHGGHDPGGVSVDKKTYEKDLVLDVAERLSKKISVAYPEVKVVQSRQTDEFITLNDRAVRANKAGANLFISIHINASRNRAAHGFSIHVLGQSSNKDRDLFAYNMDVCRLENSVILLENDYSTKYEGFDPDDPESFIFMQLMQNSNLEQSLVFSRYVENNLKLGPIPDDKGIWQNPFYVLWKTAMPAVLVELGFITNSSDLAVMKKAENRERFANCLFKAFAEYKALYDTGEQSVPVPAPPVTIESCVDTLTPTGTMVPSDTLAATPVKNSTDTPAVSAATEPVSKTLYGIQIFCSSRLLNEGSREFKGLKDITVVKASSLNKYIVGLSDNKETANKKLSEIKKIFTSAFIVKISPETEYFRISK